MLDPVDSRWRVSSRSGSTRAWRRRSRHRAVSCRLTTGASRALYNTRRCRIKSGATTVHLLGGDDRVAPYTVPMKVVPPQCCTLGRVRPAPLARCRRMAMDRSARLFLCARCRDQVLLCSHCDRGQQYCGRACSSVSRRERRRETADRYQSSCGGRLKHAARSARWRQRRRSPRQADAGIDIDVDKVTHQGCLDAPADASLPACAPPSVSEAFIATDPVAGAPAVASAGAVESVRLLCRRCGHPLRPHVRQGHVHANGARSRPAHDHRPGTGRAH